MLRAKLQAFPHVGALNLFNTKGRLINSTQDGPLPSINISSRHYFKEFTSGRPVPETILEARKSNVTGNWTVVFGRRIVGRNGEIIGFASRGVEPIHFEEFCASLALDDETSVLMILRDGTIIARYPHDDALVGRNVADTALFQKVLASNGSASGRFASLGQGEERLGSVRPLANFPILVVATTPTAHALTDWWAQTKLQFVAALLAVMVVIITIFLIVRQLKRRLDGKPLEPFVYRDFGSLVSFGRLGAIGNLMGLLLGKGLFIEGALARLMYRSLYKMHETALHGLSKTLIGSLTRGLSRGRGGPRVKLH